MTAKKGLNIKIGGDTMGLDKALTDVNKQCYALQSELKTVDRLLKLDPQNTVLLAQKQDILTLSIKETSSKLDVLKLAQLQVIDEFKKTSEGEKQFRDLQREIIETTNKLKKLDDENDALKGVGTAFDEAKKQVKLFNDELPKTATELQNTSKAAKKELADFDGEIKKMGGKVKAGFLVIGTVIASAFAGTVKIGDDYKNAMNGFISQTGIGVDCSKDFETSMKNIYKGNYGESFKDIGDAMATVAQSATDVDPKNIEKLTTNAIILHDTFDYDIQESMRAVNMLMAQFGITSDEAFNLIAQGSQNGLDKNGDLLDSINEYSVHFKQLGMNADEFFASLLNGSSGGTFSVDKLGDAVKEFGIRVKDDSKGTNEAFTAIGLNAKDTALAFTEGGDKAKEAFEQVSTKLFEMKDSIAQNKAGVALFGTMWEDLGTRGVKALTDLNSEISGSNETLKAVDSIKYDNLGSAISGIGRMFIAEFVLPISEKVMPILNDFANELKNGDSWVKPLAESMVKFISYVIDNGDKIIAVLVGIGTGLAVFKAAQMVLELVNAFKAVAAGAKIANVAIAAVAANPIGLVVTAVAGLVAGIVVLWNTNEDFKNAVIGAWDAIKDAVTNIWGYVADFFTETIPNAFNTVVDFIAGLPAIILEWLTKVVSDVAQWGKDLISTAKTEIPKFIITIVDGVAGLPKKFYEAGGNLVKGLWEGILNVKDWLLGKISGFFGGIVDSVKNMLGIQSPSKVFVGIGEHMAQGLGVGFSKQMESINRDINNAIPTDFPQLQFQIQRTSKAVQATPYYTKKTEMVHMSFVVNGKEIGEAVAPIVSGIFQANVSSNKRSRGLAY